MLNSYNTSLRDVTAPKPTLMCALTPMTLPVLYYIGVTVIPLTQYYQATNTLYSTCESIYIPMPTSTTIKRTR